MQTVEGDETYYEKPGNIQLNRNPGQTGFNEGTSMAGDKADTGAHTTMHAIGYKLATENYWEQGHNKSQRNRSVISCQLV